MDGEQHPEQRLGSLEAAVVQDLWAHGEATVGEVLARLNEQRSRPLAYNTVMSVMARLADKQILARWREGRAYRYAPALDREQLAEYFARRDVREVLAEHGEAAIAGFVTETSADDQLRERLRAALDEDD